MEFTPIPLAVPSRKQVCGSSIAGIAGSNAAQSMGVRRLCSLCVVQVAASAMCYSLSQKNPTKCVSVSVSVSVCVCVCVCVELCVCVYV